MARISVWFVRAALLHFGVGATVGAWLLAEKSGLWPALPLSGRQMHIEVVMIGWVCQLAAGVALWIFPYSRSVSADERFWTAWILLNAGILLVVSGDWSGYGLLFGLGRACELAAAVLLVWGLWPRIRMPGSTVAGD